MNQHPLSAAFPPIPQSDFAALVENVRAFGLAEPIVTLNGEVLDGWHRYRACEEAGVGVRSVEYRGADPAEFVLSHNLFRRHMSASQRAMAVVMCAEWRVRGHPKAKPAPGAGLAEPVMAKAAQVSERTVRDAKTADRAGLNGHVTNGTISVKRAAEIAKLPPAKREAAVKAKPAKKAKAPPEPDGGALREELQEAREAAAELAVECETLQEAADPKAADQIRKLKAYIKTVEQQRDDWMNQCAQLRKEVKALRRKLGE